MALILGSVLARGIIGSVPLLTIFFGTVTLVVLHWLFSFAAAKSHWFGQLVKGHTKKLVSDGTFDWKIMRQSHLSEHELMEELRLNANADDLSQVAAAYKERSGAIAVVCKPREAKVLEVTVIEGVQTVRIVIEN